ncbi:MAG: CRISPR-associated helicase Cas3' [Vicinamibacterales bacterium]
MALAEGRASWECWGKAHPSEGCPAHALLCHLLDVAAVAHHLLTTHGPRALRQRLLGLVPNAEDASLKLLLFVIALHDLGKYTPAFQAKLDWARSRLVASGFDFDPPATAQRHGAAGFEFIRDALIAVDVPSATARSLARAVAAHHGEFPKDALLTRERLGSGERGRSPRWQAARNEAIVSLRSCFGVELVRGVAVDHASVMRLAGLTSVADWIGSMEDFFPYEAPQSSVESYWPVALERAAAALRDVGMRPMQARGRRSFASLFPSFSPWPLHVIAESIGKGLSSPTLVVIEAPMGEGKTEAALLLADAAACRLGQHGLYIGLPTQATANQMFGRVKTFLDSGAEPSTLVLAHAEANGIETFRSIVAVYDEDKQRLGGVRAEEWFLPKKRALLAEYGVGTIDQALLGVLRTRHGFVRLFGLAGKTVVLDEVHAYDTFTSTILDRLLEWLAALGATVVLLSATLPRVRRNELVAAYRSGRGATNGTMVVEEGGYPRITTASQDQCSVVRVEPRAPSTVIDIRQVDPEVQVIARLLIEEIRRGGCAGWICNTVERAQTACKVVAALAPEITRLLIHARMLPEERNERQGRLEHWLGPEGRGAQRPAQALVIGTQVLEQSIDVDFDLLVTDLAPVDLVLQRAGRLHRHRNRTNRSAAHPTPRLWIAYSVGAAEDISVKAIAGVYSEALVRASVRALDGRAQITLPEDIEPLVEDVYHGTIPEPDDVLHEAFIDHTGRSIAKRQTAQTKVIPSPVSEDDIFGNLRMPFSDDDDLVMHETLRAITRDAELSVQVVCLVGRGEQCYVSENATDSLDLTVAPCRALTGQLIKRTIAVSRPSLVRALLDGPEHRPDGWQESPLLRHRRAVVFTDSVATVGRDRLRLDSELGLVIEKADREPAG